MGQKHTPGPWKWDESWGAVVVDRPDKNGKLICPMWTGCDRRGMGRDVVEEDLANARLIAAAPFLLAACKMALGAADQEYGENPPPCVDDLIPTLRAAIAKAEGA